MCVLSAPVTSGSPVFLPLFGLPYSLRQNILKLGQLITLQWPLTVRVKENLHISHLYEKLEMIKLSEEGM